MTTIEEGRGVRTRGSANLLGAWRTGPVSSGALPEDELQFWARSLRQHGGKPRPPRVVVDGIFAGGIRA